MLLTPTDRVESNVGLDSLGETNEDRLIEKLTGGGTGVVQMPVVDEVEWCFFIARRHS